MMTVEEIVALIKEKIRRCDDRLPIDVDFARAELLDLLRQINRANDEEEVP